MTWWKPGDPPSKPEPEELCVLDAWTCTDNCQWPDCLASTSPGDPA